MPEYSNNDITRWMQYYNKVNKLTGKWNNANLLAANANLDYMKQLLVFAKEIPKGLRDDSLTKGISMLEEAVGFLEEKNKRLKP